MGGGGAGYDQILLLCRNLNKQFIFKSILKKSTLASPAAILGHSHPGAFNCYRMINLKSKLLCKVSITNVKKFPITNKER